MTKKIREVKYWLMYIKNKTQHTQKRMGGCGRAVTDNGDVKRIYTLPGNSKT